MRLIPTLGLGPRRLARRPVETLLLVLAVALGTMATVTAVDTLVGLADDLNRTARSPGVRTIEVWDQDLESWTAVMSDQKYRAALGRFDHVGDYSAWVDQVSPQLSGLEVSYFDFGAAARVRVDASSAWTQAPRSLCAQPSLYGLRSVALVAGRFPTREEFDSGKAGLVVGVHFLQTLFPGTSPQDALGKELEVNRNFWEPEVVRARIVGVCGPAPDVKVGVNGDPGDWLVVGRKAQESWGQATFVAQTVDQVPALVAQLKALVAQSPDVRSMQVTDRYGAYQQKQTLSWFATVVALGVGLGSLLIALATLGSVFRARVPSLQKARALLGALGADRRILLGLDLSEILPISLGGFGLGLVGALALRLASGQGPFLAHDLSFVALAALVIGLPILQVRSRRSRQKDQRWRGLATVGFLALGLAGSSMALSLAADLGQSLPRLQAPLPLWAGLVRSQQDQTHFPDTEHRISPQDLAALDRVFPQGSWSPVISLTGQMEVTTIHVPEGDSRFWIRNKVIARATLPGFFGLPWVGVPTLNPQEPQALVSEEVAEELFGSSAAALGRHLVDKVPVPLKPEAVTETTYRVAGVFASPTSPQADLGAPDLVLVPRDEFWAQPQTGWGAVGLAFDPRQVPPATVNDQVLPRLRTSHPDATAELWSGGVLHTVDPTWADEVRAAAQTTLARVILLAGVFLAVSCLAVLGDLFVRITSRAQAIALERALGRPFGFFVRRAFFRGSLLVLGAAVLATAVAAVSLPPLASALAPSLGGLLGRSTGRVDLDPGVVILVTLGAALVSGAVATLPLLPYRRGPLSSQIGGAS